MSSWLSSVSLDLGVLTTSGSLLCAVQVCFAAVREVLAKAGVTPRQVGCVIVNCSLFNPTPSLSALIMNHFKMPSNVINYNLGGMGCSGAGQILCRLLGLTGQ